MKIIRHFKTSKEKLLHIETEGCIINILVGLHNFNFNEVTSIEVIPDAGWDLKGLHNTRVINMRREEL